MLTLLYFLFQLFFILSFKPFFFPKHFLPLPLPYLHPPFTYQSSMRCKDVISALPYHKISLPLLLPHLATHLFPLSSPFPLSSSSLVKRLSTLQEAPVIVEQTFG